MANQRIRIYNPTAGSASVKALQTQSLSDLEGKRLVILDNGWPNWQKPLKKFIDVVTERYAPSKVEIYEMPRYAASPDILENAVREGDFAVVGLAN